MSSVEALAEAPAATSAVQHIGPATLHLGECLAVMRTMADNSVDAIVTDPPYGLSFMGKRWDYDVPAVEVWAECLRVLKPGGHLLAFAGTRTQHRMAVRIEDAGFEIRDMIAWVYGSGFPKSLDVSKAIDKAAGAQRTERLAPKAGHENHVGRDNMKALRESGALSGAGGFSRPWMHDPQKVEDSHWDFAPATDAARQWQGWGTALKPALEPITLARKPFPQTVAENVLAHGTGALNIDGCRVPTAGWDAKAMERVNSPGSGRNYASTARQTPDGKWDGPIGTGAMDTTQGRFPANLIHDGSAEVVAMFPSEAGAAAPVHQRNADKFRTAYSAFSGNRDEAGSTFHADSGSAARFFYVPKADNADREDGLIDVPPGPAGVGDNRPSGSFNERIGKSTVAPRSNTHPTVKPTDLMRYLCRLVTPPGGVVLDPFMGSGSTGRAALLDSFRFVGIEREEQYLAIAAARIAAIARQPSLF